MAICNETGELSFPSLDCFDQETGEYSCENAIESELMQIQNLRKTKFNVPKSYLRNNLVASKRHEEKCCLTDSRETFTLAGKRRVIHLKEEIISGFNKTSHRMFLIPSLFLFPRITSVIITLVEVFLHVWAHRKNSRNKNPNVYYRSPLHSLTSQFCARCRDTGDIPYYSPKNIFRKKKVIDTTFH